MCMTAVCLAFSVLFTSSGVAEEMEKTCRDVEHCQVYKAQFPQLCFSSETWYKTNCPVSCERCSPEMITRIHPRTTEKHVYSDTRETTPNKTYIRSAESRDYAVEPIPQVIYILLAAAVVVIIVVTVIVVIVRKRKQQKIIQRRRQDEIQALYQNMRTKAKVHPIVRSEPGQEVHFEHITTHKPPNERALTSTDSKHNPRRLSETETPVLTQQRAGPSPLETAIYFSGIPENNSPIMANDSLEATTRSVKKIPIDKPKRQPRTKDSKYNPRRLSETETPVLTHQCAGTSPLETAIYFSGTPENNSPIMANDSLEGTTRSVKKIPIDKPRRQPRTKERSVTDQCSAHELTPMNRKKHNNYYENVHRSNFVSVDGSHFTLRK